MRARRTGCCGGLIDFITACFGCDEVDDDSDDSGEHLVIEPIVQCVNVKPRRIELPSPVKDDVVLTGRSLFLNQNVSYFPAVDLDPTLWNEGSYSKDLAIDSATLLGWRGKRALDIAGGAGLFPEEARSFDISVDVVDLNSETYAELVDRDAPPGLLEAFGLRDDDELQYRDVIRHLYVHNLEIISDLVEQDGGAPGELGDAFDHIISNRKAIARTLYDGSVRRNQGDATDLSEIDDDTYDVVLSCWMLNYLDDGGRRAVTSEAIRITKPGGEIRLQGGHEDADGSKKTDFSDGTERFPAISAERFEHWFGETRTDDGFVVGGKLVRIGERSQESLLVLRVVDYV
jgi:hypothetical protein